MGLTPQSRVAKSNHDRESKDYKAQSKTEQQRPGNQEK